METPIIQVDGIWVPNVKEDRVECPHCHRRFAEKAAERHIAKCETIKSKPKPPPKDTDQWHTDALGRRVHDAEAGAPAQKSEPSNDKVRDQFEQIHIILKDTDTLSTVEKISELCAKCQTLLEFLHTVEAQATEQKTTKGKVLAGLLEQDSGDLPAKAKLLRDFMRLKILDDTDLELCTTSMMLVLALDKNFKEKGDQAAPMLTEFIKLHELEAPKIPEFAPDDAEQPASSG